MGTAVWQIRFFSGLLVLCALFAAVQPAFAWNRHSFTYGYSLSLPEDWRINDAPPTHVTDLPAPKAARGKVDVIFQPKGNVTGVEYPCIVVEAVPYSDLGYSQQVTEEEMLAIVRATTGLDAASPTAASPDTEVLEHDGEVDASGPQLRMSAAEHSYVWTGTSGVAAIGVVRRQQWGFFGRDALIKVTLYERAPGSERLRDLAEAVAHSFSFDKQREYGKANAHLPGGWMYLAAITCVSGLAACFLYHNRTSMRAPK